MTKYLTQFMSQPTNIQPQGFRGQSCLLLNGVFLSVYWEEHITCKQANTKSPRIMTTYYLTYYQIMEQCLNGRHLPTLLMANTWIC